jgi:DNA recombination protein RmuC
LNPLKEKIQEFEKQVQETYEKETREKASLKQEINILQQMNKQISDDAKKLTSALKGDSKTQGDWGEVQVERILEKSGLEKGVNYDSQLNLKDEDGNNVRPDFVVYLPENKNFIIDSKVSLTAYEHYYNENDEQLKQQYLNDHVKSIKSHIDELSKKNYQALLGINSPDYVFLYLAVEPALTLALQTDNSIFDYAIQKNIVLVSTTTLLATMRTVSYIWKQENQKKNVFEIANEGGKLYDKFYGFMQDLISVGKNLDSTKKEYESAMNKLFTSTKKGDTIIGRIEHIKTLGANAKNALSQNLLDRINDNQEIGTDKKEENNQTLHLEN